MCLKNKISHTPKVFIHNADHLKYDLYINNMYKPVNITFTELRKYSVIYRKTIGHMMKVKGDRDSLLDHEKFKVFLVEVLGFKTSEKIYNFMVFRHFHLMDEVDKLVCGA